MIIIDITINIIHTLFITIIFVNVIVAIVVAEGYIHISFII